jgi:hypothetical protein
MLLFLCSFLMAAGKNPAARSNTDERRGLSPPPLLSSRKHPVKV